MSVHIDVVNHSPQVTAEDLEAWVAAVQRQVREHFAPVWDVGRAADVTVVDAPAEGHWWAAVLEDPDAADALGYHDLTPGGLPLAKIFTAPTVSAGLPVSGVVSHEVLEMLLDPRINTWADAGNGTMYAFEACDAVQGDDYTIDGVTVADFVHPAFFDVQSADDEGVVFDHLQLVERPFETRPGGYQVIYRNAGYGQVYGASAHPDRALARPGSRRERRCRQGWHRSDT